MANLIIQSSSPSLRVTFPEKEGEHHSQMHSVTNGTVGLFFSWVEESTSHFVGRNMMMILTAVWRLNTGRLWVSVLSSHMGECASYGLSAFTSPIPCSNWAMSSQGLEAWELYFPESLFSRSLLGILPLRGAPVKCRSQKISSFQHLQ